MFTKYVGNWLGLFAIFFIPLLPADPVPDRVEEDWVAVIGTPSPSEAGPQITTSMSPVSDMSRNTVSFNLNYRESPFRPGGLEVRAWTGTRSIASNSDRSEKLNTENETITWTQRMSITEGILIYTIRNGHSTTWGAFGTTDDWWSNPLQLWYTSPTADLSGYSPDYSRDNSDAGWQKQRVQELKIVAIRYYANGTLLRTDTTVRDCFGTSTDTE